VKGRLETGWFEIYDGTKLFLRRWRPESPPRAVIHIIHGMAEHGGRYEDFAGFLNEAGIEVWAADLRGHGKTANLALNSPMNGGLLGHCADENAIPKLIYDINRLNEEIKEQHPDLPLFILGHSWGSFLTQSFIEHSKTKPAGCILSGTRGSAGIEVKLGLVFMKLVSQIKGKRIKSRFVNAIVFGAYNKRFKPVRTSFDWLSRDTKAVDSFVEDPLCGKPSTVGFLHDLLVLLLQTQRPRNLAKINKELPIFVFSGSCDPVGLYGAGVISLINKYKKRRIKDLEFVLYPHARHECLHEINQKEVFNCLLQWILKHI